jgi:hypothetical protein
MYIFFTASGIDYTTTEAVEFASEEIIPVSKIPSPLAAFRALGIAAQFWAGRLA